MELMNVKGTNDYLPKEQRIREYIEKTLKEVFNSYGYQPIETPILCYYDLLTLKYDNDNEILKEIYKASDQGDRELALRYDLTVPFAKLITLNKGVNMPFKRYEIGKVFRDGPVKVGRNREFIQCDVDVVGIKNMTVDSEFISLYQTAFKKLNIDITIKYNNRKLLVGIINSLGLENNVNEVITVIDKIHKLTSEELSNELYKVGVEKNKQKELLECFNLSFSELKEKYYSNSFDILKEGFDEIEELNSYIVDSSNVIFDLSLARGQEYYTSTVYEVYANDSEITSSIGGGGRYDKMITNFINDGNEYPAIGISFGLNVIYEILKTREELNKQSIELYIIPMDTVKESLFLADNLREKGVCVDLELRGRKVNKALDFANKNNISYVVVLGENEVNTGKINIKNMLDSTNYEVDINDIDKIIEIIK